ncbi:DUF1430 domain-containing protein [Paenibacillus sp. AD87]|uniref:DUF1430 domain-containing protein n=1 Tax=Paenibacillus sp. AD87 TaxID=1528787 RepID=UPI0007E40DBA|nr:DUF1430 domain-containing protein [Paenibacillus sp. AD87]OAX50895.1 hypothetical protein gpAD87_22060 [Paenibacillus sp. AD87]
MSKILCVLIGLVLLSSNLFMLFFQNSKNMVDMIYGDNTILHIDYGKANPEADNNYLINSLISFSREKNINISQYKFLSENQLNIYSTNIMQDSKLKLKSGQISLEKGVFLTNNSNEDTTGQIGQIHFPLSTWDLRIYNIDDVKNVGLGEEFYIRGASNDTIKAFIEEFSIYGTISKTNVEISNLSLININLLVVTLFSVFLFGIGLFYYLSLIRKTIAVKILWGFSTWRTLISISNMFFKFSLYLLLIFIGGIIASVIIFEQQYFLVGFLLFFLINNILVMFFLFLFVYLGLRVVQKLDEKMYSLRGKLPYEKIQWASAVLKTVVSVVLFVVMSTALTNMNELNTKLRALDYWNQSLNVFRVQLGVLGKNITNDLAAERDLNNRLFAFYKDVELSNQAFLINSENFRNTGYQKEGEPVYQYTINTTNDELYSPYGRRVIINMNYLRVNPIASSDGKDIINKIESEEDVLNILVPEQFKQIENKITSTYREWFYFQKVHVSNIYNEELGYPINDKSIKDLKINIVYVKNDQEYFTFNSQTGDKENKILDPIAIIYNDSLDTSNMGAYATTSLFFEDLSQGSAYNNILPSISKTNVHEINNVVSVYNEAHDEVVNRKWVLFQQIIGFFISVILSIILVASFAWAYYSSNIYRISIKYLFGHSNWAINRDVILTIFASNVIAGIIVFLLYNKVIILTMVCIVLIIDLFIIRLLSSSFRKGKMNKILKGDHI